MGKTGCNGRWIASSGRQKRRSSTFRKVTKGAPLANPGKIWRRKLFKTDEIIWRDFYKEVDYLAIMATICWQWMAPSEFAGSCEHPGKNLAPALWSWKQSGKKQSMCLLSMLYDRWIIWPLTCRLIIWMQWATVVLTASEQGRKGWYRAGPGYLPVISSPSSNRREVILSSGWIELVAGKGICKSRKQDMTVMMEVAGRRFWSLQAAVPTDEKASEMQAGKD